MRDFVDKKIRSKQKDSEESICMAIYHILDNLQGHNLQDVLELAMPQFYFCLESIYKDKEDEARRYKKEQKKRKGRKK